LSRIPELNLKRIETLSRTLGIETVGQLKEACEQGRLRTMKGIGSKTEQRILDRIRRIESPRRILLPEAIEIAEEMVTHLTQALGATAVDVAGDLRRATETLGSLVFVLTTTRPGAAAEQVRRVPLVLSAEADGASVRGVLVDGLPYEVHVASPRAHGAHLLFAIGSPAHVAELQRIANEGRLSLARSGLSTRGERGRPHTRDEAAIYRQLGLP